MRPRDCLSLKDFVTFLQAEQTKRIDATVAYFLATIKDLDKRQTEKLSDAIRASDLAISKAEAALGKRLDLLNEFRAQVSDQRANFVGREAYDAQTRSLENKIVAMEAAASASRRALTVVFSVATFFVAVLAITLPLVISG